MSDQDSKSTPSWQQNDRSRDANSTSIPHGVESSTTLSHDEIIAQAKDFLKDDSIKSASRERKVTFLEKKGLTSREIQDLLEAEDEEVSKDDQGMTVVHESSGQHTAREEHTTQLDMATSVQNQTPKQLQSERRDTPPIITYPEFLLKPQKPPPLVTFERLMNAAYILAGASALTYGAHKYLVEPMLATLTDARHTFAEATLRDLERFNDRLETLVSHVPYTASSAALKAQHGIEEDTESVTSDPTEMFHRDIATQTTPQLSRTSSSDSLQAKTALNATDNQTSRLTSLHSTLQSLIGSIDPSTEPFMPQIGSKKLNETVTQFQAVLDKLENNYNPFRTDFSNIYASTTDPKKNGKDNNEAAQFKAEIRSLKGAFLSSRNFPTARPTRPPTIPSVNR